MSATQQQEGRGKDGSGQRHDRQVEVECDYLGADEPIEREFAPTTKLAQVKQWARDTFVPNPPSDKVYYLNDDKSRHRFTAEEEQKTLLELGYEKKAKLRLNEEQVAGHRSVT